jgi:hypothetical protein
MILHVSRYGAISVDTGQVVALEDNSAIVGGSVPLYVLGHLRSLFAREAESNDPADTRKMVTVVAYRRKGRVSYDIIDTPLIDGAVKIMASLCASGAVDAWLVARTRAVDAAYTMLYYR